MTKTYVWIRATPNSSPINVSKRIKGSTKPKDVVFSKRIILQEKPTIIFNKLCPAIKLIKSRTPRLTGLNMYETNSIGVNTKARKKLLLAGKKRENIEILCFLKHIMLIPTKVENERTKVTIKWLVVVNE